MPFLVNSTLAGNVQNLDGIKPDDCDSAGTHDIGLRIDTFGTAVPANAGVASDETEQGRNRAERRAQQREDRRTERR
jgi:hypothetical protein